MAGGDTGVIQHDAGGDAEGGGAAVFPGGAVIPGGDGFAGLSGAEGWTGEAVNPAGKPYPFAAPGNIFQWQILLGLWGCGRKGYK